MDCKIKIKLGALELEYEGNESFLKGELLSLVNALAEHHSKHPLPHANANPQAAATQMQGKQSNNIGTTNAIAHKLGVKKGPELVIAAAAHLALEIGKDTFTRKELLAEMQSATNFYNENHMKNLGGALQSLQTSKKLHEQVKGKYALTADELARLKAALA